jgi:S-formylglutathione hydrolase
MPHFWQRVAIAGKPAEVFEPPGPRRFALLWLHDEAATAPPPVLASLLDEHGLACVAPFGGRSWWLDRVCPEFDPAVTAERHLLDNVVPWMESTPPLRGGAATEWRGTFDPSLRGGPLWAVAGIGMGGQAAVRLGLRHPDRFPVVASLDGAFDFHDRHGRGTPLDDMFDTRERCRQDTAVLQLDPYRWPPHVYFACDPASECFRGNDRLHEKLAAYGVPHTFETGPAAEGGLEAMLAFVMQGLEREGRRLV